MTVLLALHGATVIVGTGAPPTENALLVVEDGRIISVRRATAEALRALPEGAALVDLPGKWIIPGLIDAHVHAESEEDLKTMLSWGVTSVRLMAEDVAAARTLAEESKTRKDIPEIFPAAPIFTRKGGWWDQGQPPDTSLNRFPATPAEARAAVRRAKELGSAEIKLMLDDMAWCRKTALPRVGADVAAALIGEARAQGLRVAVHAPNFSDAREAIADGATLLAHGVLGPFDAETVGTMKSRPVFYVPTLDVFEFLADTGAFVRSVLSDPRTHRPEMTPAIARYSDPAYAAGYRERYPNFENVKRQLPTLRENLLRLHRAGVPVALGTDMWAFPGLGVSIETDLFVRAGLTPLEAIRAATQTAARSLALRDRGTLEPGKRADFLVLDADPLRDVKNVRAIRDIYKAGRRVGPPISR